MANWYPRSRAFVAFLSTVVWLTACGEESPAPTPTKALGAAADAGHKAAPAPSAGSTTPAPEPGGNGAAENAAGADAGTPPAPPATPQPPAGDAADNAWHAPPRAPPVDAGERVYLLTRGKERTYSDASATYQLYAYDVATPQATSATIRELGGGTFEAPGAFMIKAGATRKELQKDDMVLAEWASSLKHAVVTGFEGDRVNIRYLDLPDSWAEEKITARKDPRELTRQQEGFSPGNFAIADIDGRRFLVLLIAPAGEHWLVRRFSHRVASVPRSKLTTLPLRPAVRRHQKVLAPWVGVMYRGKVRKIRGTRVLVQIDGIGQKAPIVASFGQILPLAR